MMRRVLALLATFLLLHLSVASGTTLCSMNGNDESSHEHGSQPSDTDQHQHTPAPATSCFSVTACTMTLAIADAPSLELDAVPPLGVPALASDAPHSVVRAPELPPPRL
jgi:hypothetical protein